MAIAIKIEGLDELRNVLDKFPQIAIPFVNTAIKNSIYTILRKTTPFIPVDTANLRNSFGDNIRFSALYGEMGSPVQYASSVHNLYDIGVPYHHPSKNRHAVAGFLNVGIDQSQSDIDDEFTRALDNIMRAIAR